jgi:hypothetical protein
MAQEPVRRAGIHCRADGGGSGTVSARHVPFPAAVTLSERRGTVLLNPGDSDGAQTPDFWCAFEDGEGD